ncbi:MAG: TatD family deoxyribonuclease [Verrucomicrobia bacterium]|nr:TatD family deoxyribonuclease [Verrucomicrobiota bacterium]
MDTDKKFFDTHAHLDYPDFSGDIADVIERAQAAGIAKIIAIGTDLESSQRAVELTRRFPGVYAAVGWHPTHVSSAPPDVRSALRELARSPKVVAIGETGLDYHHLPSEKDGFTTQDDARYKAKQREVFRQQLELAAELKLNCVVHQREAFDDTVAQMAEFAGRVRGVFHCFAGDREALKRVLDLGSLVSFTGILTFKNAQSVRDTLAAAPMDRFMLETDCPFLAPVPYRGKRCEPAHVKDIASVAANVRQCSLEELSRATCSTAEQFFRGLGGA